MAGSFPVAGCPVGTAAADDERRNGKRRGSVRDAIRRPAGNAG